ncbi:MAG: DMT family transporter [Bacillota bacterium]|nr:DMT family transporter [Bacillota bacterium]
MLFVKNKTLAALLAATGCHLIWGLSFMFSSKALEVASPLVLLGWRFIIAFLCINLLRLSPRVKIRFRKADLKSLILLGLCEPVIYFLGEQYGLLYTNSSFSGVMIALIPVVTIFAAIPFLKEKPTVGQVAFSLLSIAGVIVLALQNSSSGEIRPVGVLILLVAVFSATAYSIINRKLSRSYTAFERCYFMMMTGCICFPILALWENAADLSALIAPFRNENFCISLLYLSTISSVGAYSMSSYATTHLPISRTVIFANLTTAISVLAGVIFLGEPFTWLSGLCSLAIILGVWGAQRFAKPAPVLPAPEKE